MSEEKKELLQLPMRFQTTITKQGIITIPHKIPLEEGENYLFEFLASKEKIPHSQIKEIKMSGKRKYISARLKSSFLKDEDEVTVTVVSKLENKRHQLYEIDDGNYPLFLNDTNRCVIFYEYKEQKNILTSDETSNFLKIYPDFIQNELSEKIFRTLRQIDSPIDSRETDFHEVFRFQQYCIVSFFGEKRALSFSELSATPTAEAKEAHDTPIPYCFVIITRIEYLQFIFSSYIRTRIKLFLDLFQSVVSYQPYKLKEFSDLLQSYIYDIFSSSNFETLKVNSLDDIRFWFYIPSEYQEIAKKIQLAFFSNRDSLPIDELIDSLISDDDDKNETLAVVKEAVNWFRIHQVLDVKTIEGKQNIVRYSL